MFGIPMWIISLVIQILSRAGFFNAAERLGIRAGMAVVKGIEDAKVEYSYPTGKNGEVIKKIYAKGNFNQ